MPTARIGAEAVASVLRRTLWAVSVLMGVGLAYEFWPASRVEIESKDFASLGDVPAMQKCAQMPDVGPIRTRTYKHPHGKVRTWIAGTSPDNSLERFMLDNQLYLDEGESSNRWLKAPAEFAEWFDFVPHDTPLMLFGKIPGCEMYLRGLYSKRTRNFILEVGSPDTSSR